MPYSKKVLPVWEELKEKYDRKVINKYSVVFKEYDGDKQEKDIDEISKRFKKKIDGYPTIILVKENEVIEFYDSTQSQMVGGCEPCSHHKTKTDKAIIIWRVPLSTFCKS